MACNWKLRDAILDALKDDGESINQIEEYLLYLEIQFDREAIIKEIASLIKEGCIYIRYPNTLCLEDFLNQNDNNIEDFWFELTTKGLEEWDEIENM